MEKNDLDIAFQVPRNDRYFTIAVTFYKDGTSLFHRDGYVDMLYRWEDRGGILHYTPAMGNTEYYAPMLEPFQSAYQEYLADLALLGPYED